MGHKQSTNKTTNRMQHTRWTSTNQGTHQKYTTIHLYQYNDKGKCLCTHHKWPYSPWLFFSTQKWGTKLQHQQPYSMHECIPWMPPQPKWTHKPHMQGCGEATCKRQSATESIIDMLTRKNGSASKNPTSKGTKTRNWQQTTQNNVWRTCPQMTKHTAKVETMMDQQLQMANESDKYSPRYSHWNFLPAVAIGTTQPLFFEKKIMTGIFFWCVGLSTNLNAWEFYFIFW